MAFLRTQRELVTKADCMIDCCMAERVYNFGLEDKAETEAGSRSMALGLNRLDNLSAPCRPRTMETSMITKLSSHVNNQSLYRHPNHPLLT